MSAKTGVLALGAGLATFFGVAIGVTAVTEHWIDFPLLLGLLAGSIAGLVVSAAVSAGVADDISAGRRRIAATLVGFGGGFVVVLLAAASVGTIGSVSSIGIAFAVAVLVAAGVYKSGLVGSGGGDGDADSSGR